ncbi:stage V sporulation protein AC [Clostridium folliculivorans]|uniref:Stage V sporulation protein AC n=1 Tax=Clostridium folliculivorans TaxID=2886038 RepID=A0A9W5XZ49_9CLOT|nr:stage V sporulation protein AC [Clostridium folliculivorans]GKU23607.1 stage V sporulation protein AC [Clostridium folliculivorans]GKU29723.1 stage V sporulation protein AC [Clostridium folliculivorans]
MESKEAHIKKKFNQLSKESEPKPKLLRNCINAFIVGGIICDIGEFFSNTLTSWGVPKDDTATWVAIIMVFIGALLTGVGIYDKIAAFAGAGTVVPITGFANSIVSPAIEFKKEGFIFGLAAKMFTIAGPVLVYGIGTSVIVGIVYYVIDLFY